MAHAAHGVWLRVCEGGRRRAAYAPCTTGVAHMPTTHGACEHGWHGACVYTSRPAIYHVWRGWSMWYGCDDPRLAHISGCLHEMTAKRWWGCTRIFRGVPCRGGRVWWGADARAARRTKHVTSQWCGWRLVWSRVAMHQVDPVKRQSGRRLAGIRAPGRVPARLEHERRPLGAHTPGRASRVAQGASTTHRSRDDSGVAPTTRRKRPLRGGSRPGSRSRAVHSGTLGRPAVAALFTRVYRRSRAFFWRASSSRVVLCHTPADGASKSGGGGAFLLRARVSVTVSKRRGGVRRGPPSAPKKGSSDPD